MKLLPPANDGHSAFIRSKALKRSTRSKLCTAAFAALFAVGLSGPATSARPAPRACGWLPRSPVSAHVVWIVLENHAYADVIGSSSAQYLNGLARSCGLAPRFTAETHPSLPN